MRAKTDAVNSKLNTMSNSARLFVAMRNPVFIEQVGSVLFQKNGVSGKFFKWISKNI